MKLIKLTLFEAMIDGNEYIYINPTYIISFLRAKTRNDQKDFTQITTFHGQSVLYLSVKQTPEEISELINK